MKNESQGDARLIHALTLRNFLSFGPDAVSLPLENLNVLIGPNGSGKSNLLEAIALLRSSPADFRSTISMGGGVGEWIWKGEPLGPASVEAVVANPAGGSPLRHFICFRQENQQFHLEDEQIEYTFVEEGYPESKFGYYFRNGRPILTSARGESHDQKVRLTTDPNISVLGQHVALPEIGGLAPVYDRIRLYREWVFGLRNTPFRQPQKTDLRTDRLEENLSNFGMFLNRILRSPKAKESLLSAFRDLYEGLSDFSLRIEGGTVQVVFHEGEIEIPATRLSDGSVRYLTLLAILCDPSPPPLIGIEEPELGLHPDLIPKVADLLIEASTRTQLVVTTHSDILVDAMSETPASVVVCEKHEGETSMRRLEPTELVEWLEKYRLGELWTRGQLGGTRW